MAEYTRAEIVRRIATMGRLHLAGSDLAGLDLSGMTLVGADLSYADLTEADLTDAQLSDASLWSARAARARFRNANLSRASLGLADLSDADLRGAVLERADLTGARLDRADLTAARLRGAWLDSMQRAMAMGAPPLRYPLRQRPMTCVLHEDHLSGPVALRCGDRLEMHLNSLSEAAARDPRLARLQGAPILAGPERPRPDAGPPLVLAFSAIAPGRARLVLDLGRGGAPIAVEVLVSP
ncbi:pentapeptide repeat-containing protein [Paracoccus sp. P2]|uniref:Pentapeptide repeat protein n=1 Tax=Paracoccus pantotrophus TaxID=82367 RepID=A0A1I5G6S4_PARPN|nr:pentapeptide repeat-containing protein [Paracoccus pantotrophus]MDF3854342.1 pentapeptide repeat-containing protein [Paracoccus pantotrophus]QFG35505.1 pentapeptide repeat-containing protein [Paracoccus pantotrophus]QLH13750.1 pentapeptide repeat-containing protein [Paracoccus pantotrophus]RDE00878.1 pentapeptide repeat-containing protein [Paracoccus pantotrophus]RKS44267.1 pentapeptide repeat protein [Paracoccus pantotrophus]